MIDQKTLIDYEKKHLSNVYRTSQHHMASLLHDDFLETGASGKTYDKAAILNAIPLSSFTYELQAFTYHVEGDLIHTEYRLLSDATTPSHCASTWIQCPTGLKLLRFKRTLLV